jgi:hypothetical protein
MIRVCAIISMMVVLITTPTFIVFADPSIEVSPLTYDFGNVEVGTSHIKSIKVTNVGGHHLMISSITFQSGSSLDFSIINAPELPLFIPPVNGMPNFIEIEIAFQPSAVGSSSTMLDIVSNDPISPTVTVNFAGTGVPSEPPVSVADILAFFDSSVADGTLYGDGMGKSADGRRDALRNMIKAAGGLIDDSFIEKACQQLMDAYNHCDGISIPPDFVVGPVAPELASMILNLIMSLGS